MQLIAGSVQDSNCEGIENEASVLTVDLQVEAKQCLNEYDLVNYLTLHLI